jgi:uncharacterized GH25 family protein
MSCSVQKHGAFRLAVVSLVFSLALAASGAFAHDFWVNAFEPKDGLVKAEIGYGHDFPKPEPIPEDRTHLFDVLQLATPEGTVKLTPGGTNYAYEGKADLKKGSYLVLGFYHPTFWSKGPDGWAQKNRTERPDATYCEEVTMTAKAILDVAGGQESDFISKPTGQRIEIVPQVHPSTVKPGGKFPVQVLVDGKPAKTVKLEATLAGFSDKEYKAFQGRTDLNGMIDIIPLKAGYWFAEVEQTSEHENKAACDKVLLIATLAFRIDE